MFIINVVDIILYLLCFVIIWAHNCGDNNLWMFGCRRSFLRVKKKFLIFHFNLFYLEVHYLRTLEPPLGVYYRHAISLYDYHKFMFFLSDFCNLGLEHKKSKSSKRIIFYSSRVHSMSGMTRTSSKEKSVNKNIIFIKCQYI